MITGCHSTFRLSATQFNNLFEQHVDVKTLYLLGESAANGNLDCIDMLHNLALRQDDPGKIAENILFDLFSGKTEGKSGVDEEIQQASLKLYQTASEAKEKNNKDLNKFHTPSKLLYMAGSAMTDMTQKHDVSRIFRNGDVAQSQFERFDNDDLWSEKRLLMTDEINSAMKALIRDDDFSLNFPMGLINPANKSNLLSECISAKTRESNAIDETEVFPVDTGDHWILFVLHKNKIAGNLECTVFNSLRDLSKGTKYHLIDAAKIAGVTKRNIEFVNGDMHEHVPNGCGIFVVRAAEKLARAYDTKPADVFKNFIDDFSELSAREKELFNIQNRRQLYEPSIP